MWWFLKQKAGLIENLPQKIMLVLGNKKADR